MLRWVRVATLEPSVVKQFLSEKTVGGEEFRQLSHALLHSKSAICRNVGFRISVANMRSGSHLCVVAVVY